MRETLDRLDFMRHMIEVYSQDLYAKKCVKPAVIETRQAICDQPADMYCEAWCGAQTCKKTEDYVVEKAVYEPDLKKRKTAQILLQREEKELEALLATEEGKHAKMVMDGGKEFTDYLGSLERDLHSEEESNYGTFPNFERITGALDTFAELCALTGSSKYRRQRELVESVLFDAYDEVPHKFTKQGILKVLRRKKSDIFNRKHPKLARAKKKAVEEVLPGVASIAAIGALVYFLW